MVVVGLCIAVAAAMYVCNSRLLARQIMPPYARWSDKVPRLREFPRVYAYLAFSAAMVVVPAVMRATR
ncbi:MAG TPA: hypothetical protein VGD42_09755 [Lysobacter sp.]